MNACTACRKGKRRCDRVRPRCSYCVRIGRQCIYDDDALSTTPNIADSKSTGPHSLLDFATRPASGPSHVPPTQLPGPLTYFDPFQNDALRKPIIDAAVSTEVAKHIGSVDKVREITTLYFESIHKRLPIISRQRFQNRLSSYNASTSTPASFTAVCLCMHLMQQQPVTSADSMQSNLYLTAKSIVSLMEGAGYNDLDAVQCRVMIAFYELGHSIYPAALVSIAGCARLACAISLDEFIDDDVETQEKVVLEERRRVWWAVICLDRYINLCSGDSFLSTRDLTSYSPIPIDDDLWLQNILSTEEPHRLSTPSSATVGIFARECQITHLTGMVIRHVHEQTIDIEFQLEEALQLERTLMAFMPLLLEDGVMFGKYCVALGICSSALYTLNDTLVRRDQRDETEAVQKLEELSTQITGFTLRLFGDVAQINYSQLSPYVPYCVYQSAIVQERLWRDRREDVYMERATWLKTFLELLNRRWRAAGKYLKALDREDLQLVLHLSSEI